ncbi:MAG: DbpA RNA binding domain-containing protein [Spirochaetia bacterium]
MLYKFSRSEAEEKAASLLVKAGFSQPTLIQEKIAPLALQGRDLVVETYESRGKTAAFLVPALLRPDFSSPGSYPKVLILTPEESRIPKISKQLDKLLAAGFPPGSHPRVAPLAVEKNPKKELKLLSGNPDIIIGTTARVIDHIRRNNIDVKNVELLILTAEEDLEGEGFVQDILFIASKMAGLQQTLLFAGRITEPDSFSELLRRPQIMAFHDWQERRIIHSYYRIFEGKEKPQYAARILKSRELPPTLVACRNPSQAALVEKRLSAKGIDCAVLPVEGKKPNVLIGTVKDCKRHDLGEIGTLIYYQIPPNAKLYLEYLSFVGGNRDSVEIISLISKREVHLVKRIEEELKMEFKEEKLPEKSDIIRENIRRILKAVKEEENPDVLDKYKKIIKKEVPLSLRKYFTAYLVKNMFAEGAEKPQYKTLFVSVGKNRKVYPRDLARLFSAVLDLDSSDIGNIKILDNYSFIDIPVDRAKEAIDKLDGNEYRGRKLTVNYARKKEDKGS